MNRTTHRALSLLRQLALTAGLVALFGIALSPASGCSDSCDDGYVTASGECVPKCDPSKCLAGNVCVENECRLQCASHAECGAGTQSCSVTKTDGGADVQVCLPNGHLPPAGGFQGKACPFGDADCAASTCPNGLECDPNACGGNPTSCKKDADACLGQAACNIGTCPDGAACTVTTCDAAECKPLKCNSAGEGDATAYCTQTECSSDAQCGAGFHCGYVRDAHDVCGVTCSGGACSDDASACTKDGDCQKGNNAFCGTTSEPCIDLAQQPSESMFAEGPLCLMRKACLRREECSPCASNLDCSGGTGDVCVTVGKSNACVHFCTADINCRNDQACVASGKTCSASPTVWCESDGDCPKAGDTCVARSVCVPRTGSCHAETAEGSKFCFTCENDLDCGGPDSTMTCTPLANGERACFDQRFPDSCTTDADCPTSPSGAHGACLDEGDGVPPGNSVYHRCYFPAKKKGGQLVGYSCFP